MHRKILAILVITAAALAVPALADSHDGGYLADFKQDIDRAAEKLLDLADAMPADKYGWQPAEGVRSVSQAFVHVAAGNFFFSTQFGVEMPEGFSREAEETVTDKTAVIELLKKSFEHVRQAADKAAAMNLDEQVDFFGSQVSRRGVLMITAGHVHEHLGQAIAYARSNGVTPPWSRPAEAADEG